MSEVSDATQEVSVSEEFDIGFRTSDDRKRTQLNTESLFRGRIINTTKRVAKTGSIGLEYWVIPQDGEGNESRPWCRGTMYLPIANEEVEGHKAPNTSKQFFRTAHSLYPDKYPYPPKRLKNGTYEGADGTVYDSVEDAQAEANRIAQKVKAFATHLAENPSDLDEEIVIFKTDKGSVNNKTGQMYVNVGFLWGAEDPPNGVAEQCLADPKTWAFEPPVADIASE